MDYESHKVGDFVEVALKGRLEFTDHERMRDVVTLIAAEKPSSLIINLADLEFIDSAGLGMMLILQEECERFGASLRLRNPTGEVLRSLELARLNEILSIEP